MFALGLIFHLRRTVNMKRQHGHPHSNGLHANMTEHAICTMRRLPRLCIKAQDRKTLSGLVKLNQLMSAAQRAIECEDRGLAYKRAA